MVAFDAAHSTWLISSLALGNADHIVVSRSPDGVTWGDPITVSSTHDSDKNWISCDNTPASPYFGHCYTQWDDPSAQDLISIALRPTAA